MFFHKFVFAQIFAASCLYIQTCHEIMKIVCHIKRTNVSLWFMYYFNNKNCLLNTFSLLSWFTYLHCAFLNLTFHLSRFSFNSELHFGNSLELPQLFKWVQKRTCAAQWPTHPSHQWYVKKAVSQMKAGKALGPSGIVVEMIRAAGDMGASMIRELAVAIIHYGKVPSD